MRVRVPANVDMPDRIMAGLTARQLLIIGLDGVVIWTLIALLKQFFPPVVLGLLCLPVAAAGLAVATSSSHGASIDRLALLAIGFVRSPKRLVLAPEGLRQVRSSAAIEAPLLGITEDGILDLGSAGFALVSRASGLNLSLRAEKEQVSLVEGFGRLLNSLDGPMQFLIRSERVDLTHLIANIEESAGALPHPALEESARAHAAFLRSLGTSRQNLRREVLMSFRELADSPQEAEQKLARRFGEAETALRGLGIRITRLCNEEAARVLRQCTGAQGRAALPGVDYIVDVIKGETCSTR